MFEDAMPKLCIVCNVKPATVPDRARMGRPIKRVCRDCHGLRLRSDLVKIMTNEMKKRAPHV